MALEGLRESTGGGGAKVGIAWQVLTLTARFAGKKRARAIAEIIDIITFLVTLSLIVKQNIFDRPEVRAFFARQWASLSTGAQRTLAQAQKTLNRRLKHRA